MEPLAELSINVADPDDIRRKLPEVEQRVNDSRMNFEEADAAFRHAKTRADTERETYGRWQHLLASLRAMVPEVASQDEDDDEAEGGIVEEAFQGGDLTSVQLVVKIVNSAGREMRTREVRDTAAPYGLADDTVSWALWKASDLGLIRKIKRGRYAPLEHASEQSELAVSSNGTSPTETPEPASETEAATR